VPRLHAAEPAIERGLAVGPCGEPARRAGAEQVIAFAERKRHADDLQRRRRQVDEMSVAVLRPLLGQLPGPRLEVEFTLAHAADFLRPLSEQDQLPNDAAEVVVAAAGVPLRDELAVREYPRPLLGLLRVTGTDHRILPSPSLFHRPGE